MTLPLPTSTPTVVHCRGRRASGRRCGLVLIREPWRSLGMGEDCAERAGLIPPRRHRFASAASVAADPTNLLDLLNNQEVIMSVETLHENEWLSLRVVRKPEVGVNGYVYSHESRCQGRIVAVLPYRVTPGGFEYLLKSEMTPCWGFDQVLSAITGGYEGGDIEDDAVREMLEETGYAITREELIPLGECYASKSADTVYSLFSVDLTRRTPGEAIGDGTRVEAESAAVWVKPARLAEVRDPHVSAMYVRLSFGL